MLQVTDENNNWVCSIINENVGSPNCWTKKVRSEIARCLDSNHTITGSDPDSKQYYYNYTWTHDINTNVTDITRHLCTYCPPFKEGGETLGDTVDQDSWGHVVWSNTMCKTEMERQVSLFPVFFAEHPELAQQTVTRDVDGNIV